ncbi:MAG: hypothetical protein ACK41C_00725 [Phenylobacterium sp.]|jgi:hypothetical protein|uniref:hypothetical protein n=1 Tax=Phenylobacterium sp. TaxID=1871053 RepID=UPI00391B866F
MRPLVLALAIVAASASPAPAQTDPFQMQREAELFAAQQAAQQRAIALENQLFSLEARAATEQRLRSLEAQQARSLPARPPSDPTARPSQTGSFVSIPDDRLAESNARVREASGQPR